MQRLLFLVLLFFVAGRVSAQRFVEGYVSENSSSNLAAGILYPDFKSLNSRLEQDFGKPFFGDLISFGFLGRGNLKVNARGNFDGHAALYFVLPQKVQVHDSLKFQLSGWQLGYGIYGKDLLWFTKYVDLVISPGLVFGQFHIKRTDDDRRSLYANPYVAVKGSGELRFVFGKFSFGGRGEYLYDITDPKWKRKH